ncbi:MAG: hypothetical protein M3R60_01490 [Pseudomonadota bacterium]|nr:hypothetical protein [Pseudomonadota bacterium]
MAAARISYLLFGINTSGEGVGNKNIAPMCVEFMKFMNCTHFMTKLTRTAGLHPDSAENVIADLVRKVDMLARRVQELEAVNQHSLAPAMARGRAVMAAELAKPANLTLDAMALVARRSDRTINEERIKGQLYALLPEGKTRGFRYPKWQFDVPRERLTRVLLALRDRDLSPWAQHRFLMRPSMFLPGEAVPSEWIGNPNMPLDLLIRAIDARFAEDQGGA